MQYHLDIENRTCWIPPKNSDGSKFEGIYWKSDTKNGEIAQIPHSVFMGKFNEMRQWQLSLSRDAMYEYLKQISFRQRFCSNSRLTKCRLIISQREIMF